MYALQGVPTWEKKDVPWPLDKPRVWGCTGDFNGEAVVIPKFESDGIINTNGTVLL